MVDFSLRGRFILKAIKKKKEEQSCYPFGVYTEFAIPVKEYATGTRDFKPGLCLKSLVPVAYSILAFVYTKQREWAADPKGVNTGGWGLTLSPLDMAKIGQLYLDGGNIIYVNPEKKMVISIVSLFKPNAKDRIELIKKYVEPVFEIGK